jgi:DNA-binding beta-propeller fold protein YncE
VTSLRFAAAGCLLAACIPTAKEPSPGDRFTFPTGLALSPDGKRLAVLSSNFDLKFRAGRLHVVDADAFADGDRAAGAHVEVPSFGGYVRWNGSGSRLFATARGDNLLLAAEVGADGAVTCLKDAAAPGFGCDGLDTEAGGIVAPFGLAVGAVRDPAAGVQREVVFFGQLAPVFNAEGTLEARLGGVSALDPLGATFEGSSFSERLGVEGAGPMAFDAARGRLIVAGCYQRESTSSGVSSCNVAHGKNPIRIATPTPTGARVVELDLRAQVRSAQTTGIALSDDGSVAYVAMRGPDALVELELPEPGTLPEVRSMTKLPAGAGNLARVTLPGDRGEWVAAVSGTAGVLSIYDERAGAVVGEARLQKDATEEPVPFDVAARVVGDTAQFFVSLFRACAVVRVDVPLGAPWDAHVAARMGACP